MTRLQREDFVTGFKHSEALFWPSVRADKVSAWHGHVSFAHWLVSETRPETVVELGSHNGVSYAAFCNAVAKERISARCFAVDTWEGDNHAGFYGDEVYRDLLAFNSEHYGDFSTLLRCYFDEAVASFHDNTIDLLHIDGLHTYDAVKHDFDSWFPKLSSRAVVLFHDTQVFERDFGVWQLWTELCRTYPGFNFHHSAGLGVLAVGADIPPAVYELCNQPRLDAEPMIRHWFAGASQLAQQSGLSGEGPGQAKDSRNIALHCTAFQSSGFKDMTPGGGCDGVKNGDYGFHTAFEIDPWWMVDLTRPRFISRIVVYNRLTENCAARASRLKAMVSHDGVIWNTIYTHGGSVFGGIDGNPLVIRSPRWNVRFVRLQLAAQEFLHLDEVEIYD